MRCRIYSYYYFCVTINNLSIHNLTFEKIEGQREKKGDNGREGRRDRN